MPSNDPNYQKDYIRKHYQANKEYYKEKAKKRKSSLTKEQRLYEGLRSRAKKQGLSFDLEISDIIIPEFCPVLGIRLSDDDTETRPTVDKFIPSLGYTKGNICVISSRANLLKSNATLEEIRLLHEWMLSKSS